MSARPERYVYCSSKESGVSVSMTKEEFIRDIESFDIFGTKTRIESFHWSCSGRSGITPKAFNEYWTSAQRQAHSLHEFSYRACFKPQLPEFFISRLTNRGDRVYDPFMGRGTTLIEAFLEHRRPLGNDINPLSTAIVAPRLNPPDLADITERLDSLDLRHPIEQHPALKAFFHLHTLRQIIALKEYFLAKETTGGLDAVDHWLRMVAMNRLTGHSDGFFSVYSLPPNQAVSIKAQRSINKSRNQTPPSKDILPRILRRSKSLLRDWTALSFDREQRNLNGLLTTQDARHATDIPTDSTQLVVTSPPFLNVVDYQADNWMRCWFLGIDSSQVKITQTANVKDWQMFMTAALKDLHRIVRPGGYVAFEVGEVRNASLLLEELVLPAGVTAGFDPVIIMINVQQFTKTANTWGVNNRTKGTNTNRIVVFQKPVSR